jgi:transglutaminase-like putative cysteine protease
MRQAGWGEVFEPRRPDGGAPAKPSRFAFLNGLSRYAVVTWEDVVTLAIVMVGFLTVVRSIDSADWVDEMPSLYAIGFLGLVLGLVMAQSRIPTLVAHLVGLSVGLVGMLYTVGTEIEGSLPDRTWNILDRLAVWGDAVVSGGISNDNIPFVVLVVAATYLAAYLAAWSIFRWQNAWLGLIPGGLALLTNISYLPGQKSLPLVIYLFCAILLVARVNLLRQVSKWKAQRTRYPDFISLSVLNITVWMALGLLAIAWVLPVGSGSGFLYSVWVKVTAPVVEPLGGLGRVFSAIDSKKGGQVHQFGATLPLQGEISLGSAEVMQVTASETGFLRAQVYDVYTKQGWKVGDSIQITQGSWPALQAMQGVEEATRQLRRPVSLQVTASKRANVVVTAGQPLAVSVNTRVVFGPGPSDVTSVRPARALGEEDQYRVDSTVSNASIEALRRAPAQYAPWTAAYLQLPADFPATIRNKALEVTAGAATPYDKAAALEEFLRTYSINLDIAAAPPKADSVEYFLFDVQEGYFDYHASAMVVMLRSLGIPARMAVGYVIDGNDRVPQTNVYIVRELNAFAWPEVYFPGLGWVEFNPTPNKPPVVRSGIDGGFSAGINPDEQFLDDAFFLPGGVETDPNTTAALDALVIDEGNGLVSRIILTVILGVLAISALGVGIFQYSWQHGLGNMPYPVQVWEKTLRLARWTKVRPLPQETPREVVARLRQQLPEVDDLEYLGESYIRARYGRKELTENERERLEGVWKKSRNTLLSRLMRWR